MFDRIRAIHALARDIRAGGIATDEEGRAVVRIGVSDDSNFLSPFSTEGAPLISGETAEFLDHNLKHLRPDSELHIEIAGNTITDEEANDYNIAIRHYYHAEFLEAVRDMKKNTILTITMTLVAALLFATAVFLDACHIDTVFLNMLDVVAWVFMWEAADIFFFRRAELRLRRLRAYQIIRAKVTFHHT